MDKRIALAGLPLAAIGLVAAPAVPAFAQASTGGQTYTATLRPVPLNGQTDAGGTLTLALHGKTATITEDAHGLAQTFMGNPFPHVQHIHGLAKGVCPTASADGNGDGVIASTEAKGDYGAIQTTLSTSGSTAASAGTNIKIAPSGSSFHYSRTIQLNADTLRAIHAGSAVIVVHGLDPATAPKAATTTKSNLVPSLPLAATAPAICGELVASQMGTMPSGGAATGGGSTSGVEDAGLLTLGGLLVGGGGALALTRRRAPQR